MKKTEIMSEMDTTVLSVEELEENRLLLEIRPIFTGTKPSLVFLDDAGIKKLKKFIDDLPIRHTRTPRTLMNVLSDSDVEMAHKRLVGPEDADYLAKQKEFNLLRLWP